MLDSLKKSQNQLFQNNLLSQNINEIQVNNSLINYRLKENAHSRTLATIPDENQNSFLVGLTQKGNNSELVKIIYDELNKKITHKTILDFNTEKENEGKEIPQINEIIKIYPKNATDFLLNVFNSTTDQYELKFFSENKPGLFESISCLNSNEIFDVNFGSKSKNINYINKSGVKFVDLNKNSIVSEIKFAEDEIIPSPPMKISSDIFILDENVLGFGLGQDIYTVDLREKKVSHKICNTQEGNVLCFQFDPISPFGFCTSGTDFAIKFWDIRKPEKEFGGIYNNSHWIWELKYNKSYSNVMVTASSSSLVRGIIFDKVEGNEDKNRISGLGEKNIKKYSFIDYFEFEDSVYSLDWMKNDTWSFVATSFNAYFHVNTIPEEVKNRIKF